MGLNPVSSCCHRLSREAEAAMPQDQDEGGEGRQKTPKPYTLSSL